MNNLGRYKYFSFAYVIIAVAAIYLITLGLLERRGFWNVDNANKFIQLQAILESNYSDYSVRWPGSALDPEFHYNPLPHPFSVVKDHRLYSIYSPMFATVSSVFFRIFGFWGLYLLPFAFSVLLLFGLVRILYTLGCEKGCRSWSVLIAGLCTPLWFYSVVFWEHIIAVCFCVWGISYFLEFIRSGLRKSLIFGAVASALGVYFRDELYLFCALLLVAVLLGTPRERVKTGGIILSSMMVTLVPLWLAQWITIGAPLGFHIGSHLLSASSLAQHLSHRPQVLYNLFAASSGSTWLSLALTLPFLIAFLVNPKLSERSFRLAVPVCSLIALCSSIFILGPYVLSGSPITHMLRSNSLFAVSPILILAFIRRQRPQAGGDGSSLKKWLWLVALAYAVVYGLTAPELGSSGIHWGNRFLLVLYPIFAVLCTANLAEWFSDERRAINPRAIIVIVTVLVGLAAQVYSLGILAEKKAFSYRLNREIQKRTEEVVVTNVWWAPQELYSIFRTRPIFLVRSPEQYNRLKNGLSKRGYERILWVTPRSRTVPPSSVTEVTDGGLNFFNLQLLPIYLGNSQ